jgi:hypothetical protein
MKNNFFAYPLFLLTALVILTSAHPVKNSIELKSTKSVSQLNFSSMSVDNFIQLSIKDLKAIGGGKLTFKEKIVLKSLQKEFRKNLRTGKSNGSDLFDIQKIAEERVFKFNIGGFVLGLLLGLIGVGLAHIFSTDKDFRRSSWQGLGAWIILLLVLALV